MSNISDKLHDKLSQEFEYDKTKVFEFGWCNIIEAEDRMYKRLVRLYVPRDDVWANGTAKKLIKKQFKAYYDEKVHECLPEAIDLLEGKNAAGSIVLVTSRSQTANLMSGERQGQDISWMENDSFAFPEKLGAVKKLVEGVNILHGFGMVHGSFGHQTISCFNEGKSVTLRIELLNFSDVTSEDPAVSLFFEPAFMAPELMEGDGTEDIVHKSKTSDVYSLGKFVLYFLLGPANFIKFFASGDDENESAKDISSKLADHILWTNIAHSNAELEAERLEELTNEKLSSEIAEFLNYTVSHDASIRPDDAQMFYHGLTSIMGGEIDMQPTGGHWMPEAQKQPQTAKLAMIGGAVAVVLVGGFFFLSARADKQALEQQFAATNQSCGQFFGSFNTLKESRISKLKGWENVDFAAQRAKENGKAEDKLEQTQTFCDQGNTEISSLKGKLIKSLKDNITLGQANAEAEGTDFSDIDIVGELDKAKAAENSRNYEETVGILGGLSDIIDDRRNSAVSDILQRVLSDNKLAQTLLNVEEVSRKESNLLAKGESALDLEVSSENIQKKISAFGALETFNLERLSQAADANLNDLTELSGQMAAEDAGDAGVGFNEIATSINALQKQGNPTAVADFKSYYEQLAFAERQLSEVETHMNGLAAELPRLTQNITTLLDAAVRNNWMEEAQIAAISSQFNNRDSFSIFKDWSLLSKINRSMSDEVAKLEAQWAEGQSVCNAMITSAEGINNIDQTIVWAELSEILSKIKAKDLANLDRSGFADCEKGYSLAKRANIEVQAKDLLNEIRVSKEGLIGRGVGIFIEPFSEAVNGHDTLKEINLPQSQEAYDKYSASAYAILASLDKAEEQFDAASDENKDLNRKIDEVKLSVEATPLIKHPEYTRLLPTLALAEDLNILEQNAMLKGNLELLNDVVARFADGRLINCSFDNGFEMTPVVLDGSLNEKGLGHIRKAVEKSGIGFKVEAGDVSTYCIQDKPVTQNDLLTFSESLKARQADVKTEIKNVQKTDSGVAVNISYWLASRYADWVSSQVKQPVCVSPAYAAILAELSNPDGFNALSSGEIYNDSCGAESAIRKKLVLFDMEDDSVSAGCISNNNVLPELSFRLAAGDICKE